MKDESMSHAVHYTKAGEEHFEEVGGLDEAVALVERLMNEENVEGPRVFEHVPVRLQTYYRVVVDESGSGNGADTPPPGAMPLAPSAPRPASAEPQSSEEPETEETNGATAGGTSRTSLFSRG